jgi:hypothetical protein
MKHDSADDPDSEMLADDGLRSLGWLKDWLWLIGFAIGVLACKLVAWRFSLPPFVKAGGFWNLKEKDWQRSLTIAGKTCSGSVIELNQSHRPRRNTPIASRPRVVDGKPVRVSEPRIR